MKLPAEGREYWTPDLTAIPAGFTVLAARFKLVSPASSPTVWHNMVTVGSDKSVLVAGPDVDTVESANPGGTVVLPAGRHEVTVKCVGGNEVLIRDAGVIDVEPSL